MEKYLADTHALVWYIEENPKLGKHAQAKLDLIQEGRAIIYISVISLMEMDYLIHRGRIDESLPKKLIRLANATPDSALKIHPIDLSIYTAFEHVPETAVPELPDRILAATAYALKCPMITKDGAIHKWGKIPVIW